MQGVEVLNTIISYNIWTCILPLIAEVFLIYYIIFFIKKIRKEIKTIRKIGAFIWLVVDIIYATGLLIIIPIGIINFPIVTHEVTISEEVKMQEFNEKYEIIKQEGKIFTIKERTTYEKSND